MSRYLVQSVSKAETKRKTPYLRLKLVEPGGRIWPAVHWFDRDLSAGVVIDALVEEGSFGGEAQLDVKQIRIVEDAPKTDEFLPRAKNDVASLLTELKNFIDSVEDKGIKNVLLLAIDDPRWLRAPAAQANHHSFLGGLLEHTVNLCRLSSAVAALYPKIRRDLLIAACVLHDCGKIEEMSYETNVDYTTEGKLLGHIVIGLEWLIGWAKQAGIPEDTCLLLKHMVLSHHGQSGFGSPKSPQTLEAQVFSNLDGLDANIGAILAATERAGAKEWTDKTSTGQTIYLGKP